MLQYHDSHKNLDVLTSGSAILDLTSRGAPYQNVKFLWYDSIPCNTGSLEHL